MLFLRIRLLVFAAALALVPPRDARGSDTMLLEFGVAPVALSSAPAFGAQGARATAVSAGWLLSTRHALPWSGRQELSVTLLSDTGGALSHKGWAAAGSVPASGDLTYSYQRWSVTAGFRYVVPLAERVGFHLGLEAGWSHETVSGLHIRDPATHDTDPRYTFDSDSSQLDQVVLAPLAGLEWRFSSGQSLALTPRVQVLLGSVRGVAVVIPLTVNLRLW